jgi:hypothetical protein
MPAVPAAVMLGAVAETAAAGLNRERNESKLNKTGTDLFMKTKIGPSSMVSSKGYEVRRIDNYRLEYQVGNKTLTVGVEPGFRKIFWLLFPVVIVHISKVKKWDSPNEGTLIRQAELKTIENNIREGQKLLGIKCLFE